MYDSGLKLRVEPLEERRLLAALSIETVHSARMPWMRQAQSIQAVTAAHYSESDGSIVFGVSTGGVIQNSRLSRINSDGTKDSLHPPFTPNLAGLVVDSISGETVFTFANLQPFLANLSGNLSATGSSFRPLLAGMEIATEERSGGYLAPGSLLATAIGNESSTSLNVHLDDIYRFPSAMGSHFFDTSRVHMDDGTLVNAIDVTITPDAVFVVDTGEQWSNIRSRAEENQQGSIFRLNEDGSLDKLATSEPIMDPFAIAYDSLTENLLVLDDVGGRLLEVDEETGQVKELLRGFSSFETTSGSFGFESANWSGLDVSEDGQKIIVTDPEREVIFVLGRDGTVSPDAMEPNESQPMSTDLGFGQAAIEATIDSTDDEDWYSWTALAAGNASFSVEHYQITGNLDAEVYTLENNELTLLSSGHTTDDNELLTAAVRPGDRYFVRVFGTEGAETAYSLSIAGPSIGLPDTDGDGLPDKWEANRITFFGSDENRDLVDLDLPALGANPNRKDVFIEVDSMPGLAPLPYDPPRSVVQAGLATNTVLDLVVEAFLNAPVENPDGSTGINLHIEIDEALESREPWSANGWAEFNATKALHFGGSQRRDADLPNIDDVIAARRLAYRYAVFADQLGEDTHSGLAEIRGNDMMVTLGGWTDLAGNRALEQAGTFMHELGHLLGLKHGGSDHINHKPNYFSVMNYSWQTPIAILPNQGWRLDYSRFGPEDVPVLDESQLDESVGIGFPPEFADVKMYVGPAPYRLVPLSGPIDWNRDGIINAEPVQVDINTFEDVNDDRRKDELDAIIDEVLESYNDWENLEFNFLDQLSDDFGDQEDPDVAPDQRNSSDLHDSLPPVGSPRDGFDIESPNDTMEQAFDGFGEKERFLVTDLTIHQNSDQQLDEDWFVWRASADGIADVGVEFSQPGFLRYQVLSEMGQVLAEGEANTELAIGRQSFSVTMGQEVFLRIFATNLPRAEFYTLSIGGEQSLKSSVRWAGPVPNPDDVGTSWSEPSAWEEGRVPTSASRLVFGENDQTNIVNVGNRSRGLVGAEFLGDYQIVNGIIPAFGVEAGSLFFENGEGSVLQVNSSLSIDTNVDSVAGIRKLGAGELRINGNLRGSLVVEEGQLAGSGVVDRLVLREDAALVSRDGNTIRVSRDAFVDGLLQWQTDGTTEPFQVASVLSFGSESVLEFQGAAPETSFVIAEALEIIGLPKSPVGGQLSIVDLEETFAQAIVFTPSATMSADFDGDGDVDSADRTILTVNWTGAIMNGGGDRTSEQGDADGDGDVDSNDLTLLIQQWTGAQILAYPINVIATPYDAMTDKVEDQTPSGSPLFETDDLGFFLF